MGVPDNQRANVVEALRYELEDLHNCHLATGIFGTRYLFQVLSDNGLHGLAYKIMTANDFPGFDNESPKLKIRISELLVL